MAAVAAIHVRNVPESVVAGLRERAARHGQSMQEEIRQVLTAAARTTPPRDTLEPAPLTTVRTGATSSWGRREIYGDAGR